MLLYAIDPPSQGSCRNRELSGREGRVGKWGEGGESGRDLVGRYTHERAVMNAGLGHKMNGHGGRERAEAGPGQISESREHLDERRSSAEKTVCAGAWTVVTEHASCGEASWPLATAHVQRWRAPDRWHVRPLVSSVQAWSAAE